MTRRPTAAIAPPPALVLGVLACALLLVPGRSAAAAELALDNGDVLNGRIVEETDDRVVLEHPVLGRLEIPRSRIREEPPDPGLLRTGLLVDWTRQLELGISGHQGNTENSSVLGGLRLVSPEERPLWRITGRYRHSSSDGETDGHSAQLRGRRDWRLDGSPWFLRAKGTWDWDRFQDWEHRLSGHGALGNTFLQRKGLHVSALLGAGGQQEFGSGRSFRPEGLVGLEVDWSPARGQTLHAYTYAYPVLDPIGEYRTLSGADYTFPLHLERGLSLRLSFEHEYRSDVSDDVDNHDLVYATSLVLDF